MKKTQFIDLANMRKGRRNFVVKRLSVAIAVFSLAACSEKQEVQFVKDAKECANKTKMTLEECTTAYKKALKEAEKTAPKYSSRGQCEVDFGDNQCYRHSSTGFFMPFMAGFMVSHLIDRPYRDHHVYNPGFYYRNRYSSQRDRIMTADGYVLGAPNQSSYRVPPKAMKPKPMTTKTVKRGGFGSTTSAKSSWGGGRSSGGWGG